MQHREQVGLSNEKAGVAGGDESAGVGVVSAGVAVKNAKAGVARGKGGAGLVVKNESAVVGGAGVVANTERASVAAGNASASVVVESDRASVVLEENERAGVATESEHASVVAENANAGVVVKNERAIVFQVFLVETFVVEEKESDHHRGAWSREGCPRVALLDLKMTLFSTSLLLFLPFSYVASCALLRAFQVIRCPPQALAANLQQSTSTSCTWPFFVAHLQTAPRSSCQITN